MYNEETIKKGFEGQIKVNGAQQHFNKSQQDLNDAIHKELRFLEIKYKILDKYTDKLRYGILGSLGTQILLVIAIWMVK